MKWVKGKYLFKVNYKDTIDIVLVFLLLKLDRYLSTEPEVMMYFLIFFFVCLKKKLDLIFFAFALSLEKTTFFLMLLIVPLSKSKSDLNMLFFTDMIPGEKKSAEVV